MSKISVVIPSLLGYEALNQKCVESYREMYKNVQMVVSEGDNTFAENVNAGVEKAKHDVIAIVNNDTIALPGWGEWAVEATKHGIASFTPRADCGWGFAVTRQLWEQVGVLDVRLANSYEDYDFFLRAALVGKTRILANKVYVIHQGGMTLDAIWGHNREQRPERIAQCMRNREYMQQKWPRLNIDAVPLNYWAFHGIEIMKEWRITHACANS